jgi:hypothetical protein
VKRPKVSKRDSAAQPSCSKRAPAASGYGSGHSSGGYGDGTPPYSEIDPVHGHESQSSPRRGIGLLNGRYEVGCPYLGDNIPEYRNDFGLIATLDGTKLWLMFDFGPIIGIMQVDRPTSRVRMRK